MDCGPTVQRDNQAEVFRAAQTKQWQAYSARSGKEPRVRTAEQQVQVQMPVHPAVPFDVFFEGGSKDRRMSSFSGHLRNVAAGGWGYDVLRVTQKCYARERG